MNQTQSVSSGISISSKHFSNQIESSIIQLTKCLAIEHQIPIDDAKEMARQMVQIRLNSLFSTEVVEKVSELNKTLAGTIRDTNDPKLRTIAIELYHLIKLVALDNV